MSGAILELRDLDVFYGPIQALRKVSMHIDKGETVSLIGANGAGKSTLLMSIFGQPRAASGQILYEGTDITRKTPHYIASNGIAQSPEGRRVFPDMTVEENLMMGTIPIGVKHADADMQRMYTLFPRLKERRTQRAMTMSGGEQQMLAIARALMSRPRLLLLDEPSLGLAPRITAQIFATLRRLREEQSLTVVLVEQNARSALSVSDQAVVLNLGRLVVSGPAGELAGDEKLRHAYLGF